MIHLYSMNFPRLKIYTYKNVKNKNTKSYIFWRSSVFGLPRWTPTLSNGGFLTFRRLAKGARDTSPKVNPACVALWKA